MALRMSARGADPPASRETPNTLIAADGRSLAPMGFVTTHSCTELLACKHPNTPDGINQEARKTDGRDRVSLRRRFLPWWVHLRPCLTLRGGYAQPHAAQTPHDEKQTHHL